MSNTNEEVVVETAAEDSETVESETVESETVISNDEIIETEILSVDKIIDGVEDDLVIQAVGSLKYLSTYCCKLFYKMFTNPLSVLQDSTKEKSKFPSLLWGVFHLLIVLIVTAIYMPFVNNFISLDAKLELGAFYVLVIASTIFVHAIVTYGTAKLVDRSTSFKSVLSYFSLATVPGSVLIILAFIFKFIYVPISLLLVLLAYFGWVLMALKATEVSLNSRGYAFWLHILNTILAFAVGVLLVIYVGLNVFKSVINDLFIHIFTVENIMNFINNLNLAELLTFWK